MCQALGRDGAQKYEHSGGPGMTAIGDLIRLHSTRPEADIRRFGDALVYSWLVINRDAHARNYSIIHGRSEECLKSIHAARRHLNQAGHSQPRSKPGASHP